MTGSNTIWAKGADEFHRRRRHGNTQNVTALHQLTGEDRGLVRGDTAANTEEDSGHALDLSLHGGLNHVASSHPRQSSEDPPLKGQNASIGTECPKGAPAT